MRKLTSILILILTINCTFGQDLVEKTYLYVIKDISTAPNFVVIKIRNKQNGMIKEICTDAISLYWSLQQEYKSDFKIIYDTLSTKSNIRLIDIGDSKALERLNFSNYNAKNLDRLFSLIKENNLIDSLKQLDKFRLDLHHKYYPYRESRENIIGLIRDSIGTTRKLTTEEIEMLNRLDDPYYDYHYNDWYWNKLTAKGKELIKIWNNKIKVEKEKIELLEKERDRQENNFFYDYFNKYGIVFCHSLFYYGVTCYQDCENGQIRFGEIIEINE